MSEAVLKTSVDDFQDLIEKIAKEKLTLTEWQSLYSSVIVLIGLQIAQEFKRAAVTGHPTQGPHHAALDLAAFSLSLSEGKKRR
jgi:hypothetical protein